MRHQSCAVEPVWFAEIYHSAFYGAIGTVPTYMSNLGHVLTGIILMSLYTLCRGYGRSSCGFSHFIPWETRVLSEQLCTLYV